MGTNEERKIKAAKRDRKWCADFIGGMSYREIAERDNTAIRYVGARITRRFQGVSLSEKERKRRLRKNSRGRPPVWPDCPPHLYSEYMRLRTSYQIPAAEARKMLEAEL